MNPLLTILLLLVAAVPGRAAPGYGWYNDASGKPRCYADPGPKASRPVKPVHCTQVSLYGWYNGPDGKPHCYAEAGTRRVENQRCTH